MASFDFTVLMVAKDMASKTIGKVGKQISGLDKAGRTASRGLQNLAGNLAKIGVVAAAGIGVAVHAGIQSLADLESATTSVDGAIKQLGLTGKVTSSQVATWANEIENSIGAAFDDKAIVAGTAALIRYGKVTDKNLRPAMEVMTDLAAKTGSVESAATLLAKALADPEKAAGKLARQGVVLTKAEQEQIKAFMKAGKVASAQDVILKSLAKTTTGAAAATQGPYKRALAVLADVTEDAQRALAEGFLPVLEKVAAFLSKELAKPATIASIREFGKGLASGLDSLIEIAKSLPWDTIGNSLKIAGAGAKAVLGAFTALPPWVQTAVLTGWGLNKLTGGALGSLIGQLGSGLIKGVLGMTAGVVNLKAATVVGGGGIGGGAAGGAVAGGGKLGKVGAIASTVGKVFMVGMAVGAAATLAEELGNQSTAIREQATGVRTAAGGMTDQKAVVNAINTIDEQLADPLNNVALSITNPLNGAKTILQGTRADLQSKLSLLNTTMQANRSGIGSLITQTSGTRAAVAAGTAAYRTGAGALVAATSRTTAAINSKDWSPRITVPVSVATTISIRSVTAGQQVTASYSRPGVSAGATRT